MDDKLRVARRVAIRVMASMKEEARVVKSRCS